MRPTVYVATRSDSRYSLLGSFGEQVLAAMARRGVLVNPDDGSSGRADGHGRSAYVLFNHPGSMANVHAWAGGIDRDRAIVQWCVDHPLTLSGEWLEACSKDPGFRLLTVTDDDAHLLSMRAPKLRHLTVWHGVDPSALCDERSIESSHALKGDAQRDIEVIIPGSIASIDDLKRLRQALPAAISKIADEIVQLRLAHPAMSFGQSMDIAMPPGVLSGDPWKLMSVVFAYTTAAVGRLRRAALVRALRGVPITLIGNEALRDLETSDAKYAGSIAYHALPSMLARAKVMLSVAPAQFVTGFSERVLLGLAAGCACVCEERYWSTREFGSTGSIQSFAPDHPELARERVLSLLSDAPGRAQMGKIGRRVIAENHLWDHRVPIVLASAQLAELPMRKDAA